MLCKRPWPVLDKELTKRIHRIRQWNDYNILKSLKHIAHIIQDGVKPAFLVQRKQHHTN